MPHYHALIALRIQGCFGSEQTYYRLLCFRTFLFNSHVIMRIVVRCLIADQLRCRLPDLEWFNMTGFRAANQSNITLLWTDIKLKHWWITLADSAKTVSLPVTLAASAKTISLPVTMAASANHPASAKTISLPVTLAASVNHLAASAKTVSLPVTLVSSAKTIPWPVTLESSAKTISRPVTLESSASHPGIFSQDYFSANHPGSFSQSPWNLQQRLFLC